MSIGAEIALWVPIALLVLGAAAVVLMRSARFGGPAVPPSLPGKKWGGIAVQYLAAAAMVAVAAVLRWWLEGSVGPLPTYITFYPAVLLAATIGGGGPGIVATVLSALAADYWFVSPYGQFSVGAPNDVLALGIFIGTSLFLSVLAERLRRTRWAEAVSVAQQQQLEELARLNEELSQQAEELSQQTEELAHQNEELQTQSEEIQGLNHELAGREDLLQKLLDAARLASAEQTVMRDICAAAKEMFGPAASAVIVLEPRGDWLAVRGQAGLGPEGARLESLPAVNCFTELVIAENRTAALADASLRPDLTLLQPPGEQPFQAVLAAPMRTEGRPFAVVGIFSRQRQEWTAEQFRLAEWLAAQCTHILETLRLQEQTRRQAALIDLSPDAIMVRKLDGTITFWSRGAETLYGWTQEEALGRRTHELFQTRFPEPLEQIVEQVQRMGRWSGELIHRAKDGREVVVQSRWLGQLDAHGEMVEILESNVDITERQRAQKEREIAIEFFHLVNASAQTHDLIQAATTFFQQQSGCQAVGVRLQDGDDYPYYEARGFPQEFLLVENSLCGRDSAGAVVRDSAGAPLIECMCGNVIRGRFDPSKPFFTAHGSFWTNCTTELLASTSEADRQGQTRNRCNGEGYESVALMPLRVGEQRLGLLQLNDRRKAMFSPAVIALWERLAGHLAVALAKLRAEDEVRQLNANLEQRVAEQAGAIRKANEVLTKEQQRFREVLDMLPAYVVLLTPDYHVPFANRFFEERFGKSEGRRCYEYLFNRNEPCETCETYTVLKTNAPHHWEWTGPDGRNYDIHDFPFTDSDGSPLIMEVGVDITQRKRAEAALKEVNRTLELRVAERTESLDRERGNLRAVFDVVNVGMLVIAEDGDVKQVNDTLSRWVKKDVLAWEGGQPGDFVGCVHALAEPAGCGHSPQCATCPIRNAFASVLQTGQPVHDVEAEALLSVDGSEVPLWLEVSADPLVLDGKRHVILAMNNITDRKRAEQALKQTADDLARSNKDLEQFAYVASHDLKEPLRMVTGFMSLLSSRYKGKLDAKADEYIFYATDAATRMLGLIDDLLAYSRAGRGQAAEPTDVAAVVAKALKGLKAGIQESGATVTRDPLPTIKSNALELIQVFQNLIGNAIKFKGQRKPEIHVGAQRRDEQWLFTVRDNGIGIDPQFADRIFMIFQRLHTREQYPGTGIGLAICKKVVESHGGRIWVESQPGVGSTFSFTIPDQGKEQE